MFLRIKNILFIVVVSLIFSTVLIVKSSVLLNFELPEEFKVNRPKSYLEGRTYQSAPDFTVEAVLDGVFQEEVESYIADLFPNRDSALEVNAAVQRSAIYIAAYPFGYTDLIPTFYGSEYIFSEKLDAVYPQPLKASQETYDRFKTIADSLNGLSENNKEQRFFLFLPEHITISQSNPANLEISSVIDSSYYKRNLLDQLDESFKSLSNPISEIDNYFEMYYRSETHWSMRSIYDSYVEISEMMELEAIEPIGDEIIRQEEMYGNNARNALCCPVDADHFIMYDFNLPEYKVSLSRGKSGGNEMLAISELDKAREESLSSEKYIDWYSVFFPSRGSVLTVIENEECLEEKNLLIVGDSFSRPLDSLFAFHYSTTVNFDPRYMTGNSFNTEENLKTSISELIQVYEIDDVLILLSPSSLNSEDALSAFK